MQHNNNLTQIAKLLLSQLRYNEMLKTEKKITSKDVKEAKVLETALIGVGSAQEGEPLAYAIYLNFRRVTLFNATTDKVVFDYQEENEEEGLGI